MAEYQRLNQKGVLSGIDATHAPDSVQPGFYVNATNVASFSPNVIRSRPGTIAQNSSALDQTSVHSIKRLNDFTQDAFAYIVGAGTKLYITQINPADGGWTFSTLESDFSGLPITWGVMRPDQSPRPYLFLSDSVKQRKVDVNGTIQNWGIRPPVEPPTAQFADPSIKDIETFESVGSWANSGTAGSISTGDRISTTIATILYDDPLTNEGFASVIPGTFTQDIQPDMRIFVDHAGPNDEEIIVDAVFQPAVPSGGTTIESIIYDDTLLNTGLCTIQPSTSILGLIPDALIELDSSEFVRVLSVTPGVNDINSFRCSTIATFAASDAIDSVQSFRAFFELTHVALETLEAFYFEVTVAAGIGYITLATPFDFSTINNRPTQNADLQHVSIFGDNLGNLTELKIEGDCDSATNTFTENFFSIPFTPNDLVPFAQNTLSTFLTQQRAIQRQQVSTQAPLTNNPAPITYTQFGGFTDPNSDYNMAGLGSRGRGFLPTDGGVPDYYNFPADDGSGGSGPNNVQPLAPNAASGQTTTGDNQWSELSFTMGSWLRQGADSSRGWQDIQAIRILLNVTDTTVFRFSAWWIGGTYGPDVSIGAPINYRFVDVNGATGEQSNPSPPMRSGILPVRQRVQVSSPAPLDSQATRRDFYRIGGSLLQWIWVGSAVPGDPFFDERADSDLGNDLRILDFTNFQPFLVNDLPHAGVIDVIGTSVIWVSGDLFDISWAPGAVILINGQPFVTYTSPSSTTRLEITTSAGTQSGVSYEIQEPQKQGQALAFVFGPYTLEGAPIFLAVGNDDEPGVLFSTTPNTPGSMQELGKLEITSPDDPLMGGGIYDGRIYVWSTKVMYLVQTVNGVPSSAQPIAHAKGLYARYGICVGRDAFYFWADDGIYTTKGGIPYCITDAQLYLLFSHAGFEPTTYNGIGPPNLNLPNSMRLNIANDYLWADFVNQDGDLSTFVYNTEEEKWNVQSATVTSEGNWLLHSYNPSAVTHYGIEGESQRDMLLGMNDGRVYLYAGTSDGKIGAAAGVAISSQLTMGNLSLGDERADKLLGDFVVDADAGTFLAAITVTKSDGSTVAPLVESFTNTGRRLKILDLDNTLAQGRWAQPSISWFSNDSINPNLYGWELSYLARPETIFERPTDYDALDIEGNKYMQGIIITGDTDGLTSEIQVQYDGGQVGATLSVNHDGLQQIAYWFDTPFIARMVRLVPTGDVPIREFHFTWRKNPAPDMACVWNPPRTSMGFPGYWHARDAFISHLSTADITWKIYVDDNDLNPFEYTLTSSGGTIASRVYVPFQAAKGKLTEWRFESDEPCAIFLQDCIVNAKGFGLGQAYQQIRPFGGPNFTEGALI